MQRCTIREKGRHTKKANNTILNRWLWFTEVGNWTLSGKEDGEEESGIGASILWTCNSASLRTRVALISARRKCEHVGGSGMAPARVPTHDQRAMLEAWGLCTWAIAEGVKLMICEVDVLVYIKLGTFRSEEVWLSFFVEKCYKDFQVIRGVYIDHQRTMAPQYILRGVFDRDHRHCFAEVGEPRHGNSFGQRCAALPRLTKTRRKYHKPSHRKHKHSHSNLYLQLSQEVSLLSISVPWILKLYEYIIKFIYI